MTTLPRIAWFSTVNARVDSLARYTTAAVLPHLKDRFEIELFTDSNESVDVGVHAEHFLNARRRHKERSFDLFVYNIEDGPSSRFARAHLGLIPGVVWLHHAALADLGSEAYHSSPWEYTLDRFLDPTTPFNRRDNPVHPLWPLAYRERSLATLLLSSSKVGLHQLSPLSGRRLEAYPGGHRALHLPVPCAPLQAPSPLPPGTPLTIASASRTGIAGEMHKVFLALKKLTTPWHLTWMVDERESAVAHDLVSEFTVGAHTTIVIGRTPETWRALVERHAVAVHLHNSPFDGVAPYLQISLGVGRPVIVSGYAGISEVPEDVALRVEPGVTMGAQLHRIFAGINASELPSLGSVSRTYAELHLSPATISQRLGDLLAEHIPVWRSIYGRWEEIAAAGEAALRDDTRALVESGTAATLPSGAMLVEHFFAEFGGN